VTVPILRARISAATTLRARVADTLTLKGRVLPSVPALQVELRVSGGFIQWRLGADGTWVNLIATADLAPSALEILALLLTVDGAGSLLDADTVDGQHASEFQPIDADLTAISLLSTTAFGRALLELVDDDALASLVDGFFLTPAEGNAAYQPLDSDLTAIAALTTLAYGRSLLTLANATALAAEVDAFFLTPAEGNAAYQPLDADLTAIAALTTTAYGRGLLELADETALEALLDTLPNVVSIQGRTVTLADAGADALWGWDDSANAYINLSAADARTALGMSANAQSLVTAADYAAMRTLLGLVIGTNVQAFDADLSALAANSTDGFWAHTGAGTGAARTLTAPAAGLTISNPAGIAGNPTFALANDLAALEGLGSTGLAVRTAADTWAQRTIAVTASTGLAITDGNGVAGNPTLAGVDATTAIKGVSANTTTTEVLIGTDTAKSVTADALAALWEKGSNVASAGTVSLGEGGFFHITGTTTITDIDFATAKDGRSADVIFDGILTLTHNGTTLVLPTGGNITTAAGDRARFVQDASDNVVCLYYQRADGSSLAGGGGGFTAATQAEMEAASSNSVGVTPGRQQFHPSSPKCWGYINGSGGTPALDQSYGISSVTDNGPGDYTANLSVTFSAATFAPGVSLGATNDSTANDADAKVFSLGTTTIRVRIWDDSAASLIDQDVSVWAWGDL
jgi:hypothetical protein